MAVLAAWIDAVNERLGRAVAWLALGMVVIEFVVVVLRYVFGLGWPAVQELVVYMHAVVFLGAVGYTLLHNGHVRVDIFYAGLSARGQAWVDLVGVVIFLLPMSATILIIAWPYVTAAWAVREGSPDGASGLPAVYLLKSTILAFGVLLGLQGLSLALRSWMTIAGFGKPLRSEDGEPGL